MERMGPNCTWKIRLPNECHFPVTRTLDQIAWRRWQAEGANGVYAAQLAYSMADAAGGTELGGDSGGLGCRLKRSIPRGGAPHPLYPGHSNGNHGGRNYGTSPYDAHFLSSQDSFDAVRTAVVPSSRVTVACTFLCHPWNESNPIWIWSRPSRYRPVNSICPVVIGGCPTHTTIA